MRADDTFVVLQCDFMPMNSPTEILADQQRIQQVTMSIYHCILGLCENLEAIYLYTRVNKEEGVITVKVCDPATNL